MYESPLWISHLDRLINKLAQSNNTALTFSSNFLTYCLGSFSPSLDTLLSSTIIFCVVPSHSLRLSACQLFFYSYLVSFFPLTPPFASLFSQLSACTIFPHLKMICPLMDGVLVSHIGQKRNASLLRSLASVKCRT